MDQTRPTGRFGATSSRARMSLKGTVPSLCVKDPTPSSAYPIVPTGVSCVSAHRAANQVLVGRRGELSGDEGPDHA